MRESSDLRNMAEERLMALDYTKPGLEGLYAPVRYGLGSGGKRLRPLLVLMGCEAFGVDAAAALDAACGVEIFHNFTLLHDDVMDASPMRRGRPSVYAKWDLNTAILSGDTMLTLATQLVSAVPDKVLRPVLDVFNRMAIEVYEGQRLDMDFEERPDVGSEEYIRMIELKTGALLGGSARIGALIGCATEKQARAVDEYGRALGVAFQIQDDYLDCFGDELTFGKPIGGDIVQGKKTFLLLEGLASGGPDSEALRDAMKLQPKEVRIQTVKRLYEKMYMEQRCRKAILHWTGRALRALKQTGLDEADLAPFHKLADKLTGRRK